MKFIISGSTGYIGKNLAYKALELGHTVYGLSIDQDALNKMHEENNNFIPVYLDNKDFNKLPDIIDSDIDCFFHLSWNGVYGESFKDYRLQLENCLYSCDAVSAAIKMNCKKFILASTVDTLEVRNLIQKNVDSNYRYANIYATSKLCVEMIGKILSKNANKDFSFYSALIPTLYGEGNKTNSVIHLFLRNLLEGKKTNFINYDTKFDIVYIDEVCSSLLALVKSKEKNKTYYIGHTEPFIFGDLINHIMDVVDNHGIVEFGSFGVESEVNYDLIDLELIKKDTGYYLNKDKVDLNIIKTYNWIKNNL